MSRSKMRSWRRSRSRVTIPSTSTEQQKKASIASSVSSRNDELRYTQSLNVVPAKAGTHTPGLIDSSTVCGTTQKHERLWVWVPAFAGTTESVVQTRLLVFGLTLLRRFLLRL